MHSIPDLSQFQVLAGRIEITKEAKWPAGKIEAIPYAFPVNWRIEFPQATDGVIGYVQPKMTPLVTAREVWDLLHHEIPGLYEDATLDYRGFLRPGLTVSAEIVREDVRVSVSFEVIRKGTITYILEVIPNMVSWQDIHGHFARIDRRIPPFEGYINEENRPYYPETCLSFRLAKDVEVPDITREFGGAAGGVSKEGFLLPPIVSPKAPINITSPGDPKVVGSAKGPLDADTDSSSDSAEDDDGEDDHKLHKIAQAIAKGQPLTVEIRAEYAWEG
jgi:hypothetical protein